MNETGRANSFASVNANDESDELGFKPKTAPKPVLPNEQIDRIAEATGFGRTTAKPRRRRTRAKTDLVYPFSTRISLETSDRIYALADELRKPLGTVLEEAMIALIEKLQDKRSR